MNYLSLVFRNFDITTLIASFIPQFVYIHTIFILTTDVQICVWSCIVILYTSKKIIKIINKRLNNYYTLDPLFQTNFRLLQGLQQYIVYHNRYCTTLYEYNKFWCKIYLVAIVTLMPQNLIMMHQVFFENLPIKVKINMTGFICFDIFIIVILQYSLATINREVHRMTVPLSKLQWKLNEQTFVLRPKIKLMCYFERLSSNRKIGITIGPFITLTIPIFSQVRHN